MKTFNVADFVPIPQYIIAIVIWKKFRDTKRQSRNITTIFSEEVWYLLYNRFLKYIIAACHKSVSQSIEATSAYILFHLQLVKPIRSILNPAGSPREDQRYSCVFQTDSIPFPDTFKQTTNTLLPYYIKNQTINWFCIVWHFLQIGIPPVVSIVKPLYHFVDR